MMKRILLAALAAALVMAAQPAAFAHAFLDNATPKVGSVVTVPPKTIRIQFTQPVEAAFSNIQLFTADGKPIGTGPAATDPSDKTQLIVPITGTLVPGQYIVRWHVIAVDTHHTDGHFPFTYQP
jgi:methionine-rich copper-binding protein CopC